MPDDFFYDAINIFKYSPTGQGHPNIEGPLEYRRRYVDLARAVTDKLWELWAADEIAFASLNRNVSADSSAHRWGADIRVDFQYRNNLAVVSFLLVHEAVHLVMPWQYVIEDILCRNLQYSLYADLLRGRTIHSRVNGDRLITVQATDSSVPRWAVQEYQRFLSGRIVDSVVGMEEYNRSLTCDFIRESFDWWGGPANREFRTLALYIHRLVSDSNPLNVEYILRILEAINGSNCNDWRNLEREIGTFDDRGGWWERVRGRLFGAGNSDGAVAIRITALEEHWGVNLGGFAHNPRDSRLCPVP
jgi:hypothetical protein